MDRQIHTLGTKIQDKCIAFEITMLVGVELDTWLPAVDLFGNDAAAGEDGLDFLFVSVEGEVGNVDGCIFAFAGFGGGFRFFGFYKAATLFL